MSDSLGELKVYIGASVYDLEKGMKKAEATLRNAERKFKSMGRTMSLKLTAPLALIGGMSVKAFANFDDAMTRSTAIMGNISSEMRAELDKTARQISLDSKKSATELAESYFFLASAGMNAEQSMANLRVVERFATAGTFDMAQATDLLTDAQSALGLNVKDVAKNQANMVRLSDVLVKANTLANASVEQFSTSLTNKAGPALRLLNKDAEEGVAVLAAFADQGIKGEKAGEALNIVFRDLQKSAIGNQKQWEAMGLSIYGTDGRMRNIADIVGDLETKFSGLSDEGKKIAAIDLGFQERSFAYIQTLFGTSDKIRNYEKELRKAGGTTQEVAGKNMMSFSASMAIMRNQITDAAITIGKILAPAILKVGEVLKAATAWFENLSSTAKRNIVIFGVVAASIGPILIGMGALFGLAGAALSGIAAVGAAIGTAFGFAATVAGVLFSPIGLIIALVAALTAGIIYLAVKTGMLGRAWDFVKEHALSFAKATIGFIWNIKENFTMLMDWLSKNWKNVFIDMGSMMMTVFKNIGSNMVKLFKGNMSAVIEWAKSGFTKDLFDLALSNAAKNNVDSNLMKGFEAKTKIGDLKFNTDISGAKKMVDGVKSSFKNAVGLKPDIPDFAKNVSGNTPMVTSAGEAYTPTTQAEKSAGTGSFKVTSLKRMAVSGLPGQKKKQSVEAKGVEKKLDVLTDIVRKQQPVTMR